MKPMFLHEVENNPNVAPAYARITDQMRASGILVPKIFHLFAFKPDVTKHLERLSQAVMRGPSPLSPGMRELLAAFTSQQNHCPF